MNGPLRVLAIPAGETKDADGRALGDDWHIAAFGQAPDGMHVTVTTDCLRASDMCDIEGLGPLELATFLVERFNAEYEKRNQMALPGVEG